MSTDLIVKDQSLISDYGTYIQYPLVIAHASPELSPVSIAGHSGDLLTSNHRYPNITQTFNLYATTEAGYETWSHLSLDINQWLVSETYQPIYINSQNDWRWEGYLSQPASFTPQNDFEATASISFNCKPFMKRLDGAEFKPIVSPVINTEQIFAEPTFHIIGNGDFVIEVNGQDYKLNGVDGEIFVDSEMQWIYKHSMNENRSSLAEFPNNDFPILIPGENTIALKSGTASVFEFKPNWRKLA